ncbi:MAG: prolipoprotein diacylglyceryl transferase family protein [Granulicella sp.]
MHSSFFQFGQLHIPVYGVFAAVGLMAALALSQRTARLVRLDAGKVWDAALTMVVAALVFSRVLLVAGSWHSFLEAPLLVLSLPSLNDTGVLMTAIFMVVYLRWKKLPLLGFLDAMGPCFALVWAFLSLGELVAGTRDGMPTQSLLAMKDDMLGKVQPVELYTMLVAMVLCGVLLRWMPRRGAAGLGFGLWLVLTGGASCLLGFLRLPSELYGTAMLDPAQWIGLMMMIVGAALFLALPPVTAEKEANDAV